MSSAADLKSNQRPSLAPIVSALKLSFALDLIWLVQEQPLVAPSANYPLAPFVASIAALYLGHAISTLDAGRLSKRRTQLRSTLEGLGGTIGLGLFTAAVAFEIASYLSNILALTLLGRIALAVIAGLCAIPYKGKLLRNLLEHRKEVHPEAPFMIGTALVRIAAGCLALAEPGALCTAAWVMCLLYIPQPSNKTGRRG